VKPEEVKLKEDITEELVDFELEESIYSYLLFLLSMEEKEFKKMIPRH